MNTTSTSLAEALGHFPGLVFVDLSNTSAARDHTVLSKLKDMPNLQVLKLRNVHLRDDDVQILAEAIDIRIRSLDLRGNHLTDRSIRTLLNLCFQTNNNTSGQIPSRQTAISTNLVEDWPAGILQPDPAVLDEFRDESFDEHFVRRLTKGLVSRLPFEDLHLSGITHLYIADNHLTVEGLTSLVRTNTLHVLDAGTVESGRVLLRPRPNPSTCPSRFKDHLVVLPGIEKLTPVLERHGSTNITFLRLNHAVVTRAALSKDDTLSPGACELHAEESFHEMEVTVTHEMDAAVHEMDATVPTYELPSEEATPRYELPGNSMHIHLSPANGEKSSLPLSRSSSGVKRGSVFAPETVDDEETKKESKEQESPVLTATGLGHTAQAINGIAGADRLRDHLTEADRSKGGRRGVELSAALIQRQRNELRARHKDKPHGLSPGTLPGLRTLVLTDVPCYDNDHHVIDTLIEFIRDCASEAELASLQVDLLSDSPPTFKRPRQTQKRKDELEIFALQRIVLEMAPPSSPSTSISLDMYNAPLTPSPSRLANRTKSSTEDADSEALWHAHESNQDFSFFGDEECGVYATDSNIQLAISSEKMVFPTETAPSARSPKPRPTSTIREADADVIQQLAKFRRERKAAFENAKKQGVKHVDGHWPGEVKVIKWTGRDERRRGTLDYYGNYFDKGVYR